MIALVDSSVLVSSLIPDDAHHEACHRLLSRDGLRIYVHAIAETFSTLTGGRHHLRVDPVTAANVIEQSVIPFVKIVALSATDFLHAVSVAQARGIRGGAIYDYLHLAAARKAKAEVLYTLNVRHFESFYRKNDPRIVHP